jgi:predicted transcriptional regulator
VVVVDVGVYQSILNELAELRDIHRGLADVHAGRVVSHEEVVADVLGGGR